MILWLITIPAWHQEEYVNVLPLKLPSVLRVYSGTSSFIYYQVLQLSSILVDDSDSLQGLLIDIVAPRWHSAGNPAQRNNDPTNGTTARVVKPVRKRQRGQICIVNLERLAA
ncbi:hypothetical protein SCLCIDRAFT_195727 [Scleroderma citrinum Foug A]|uniref:Uncharacterized protein n=1 Tax=Scleroderma citrinum Foug A TaxID=1036808 RepID=A0A0C2ZX44_9AGAM|nr:hypothetical protein SCLCIDRAFT_195727 [Scleroderma citrinum Foug A]